MSDKSDDDATLTALRALAKEKGKSIEEVLADLLRAKAEQDKKPEPATALAGTQSQELERYEFKRNSMTSPHLSPERIAMYERESAEEARERWAEEESQMPGGVYSPGGTTAGGIFGDGVIATENYDPASDMRYERRAGSSVQLKTLQVLEQMKRQLDAKDEEIRQLEGRRARGALPGRRRGG